MVDNEVVSMEVWTCDDSEKAISIRPQKRTKFVSAYSAIHIPVIRFSERCERATIIPDIMNGQIRLLHFYSSLLPKGLSSGSHHYQNYHLKELQAATIPMVYPAFIELDGFAII